MRPIGIGGAALAALMAVFPVGLSAQEDLPEVPEAYKDLWCGIAFATSAGRLVSTPGADTANVPLYIRLSQGLMARALDAYVAAGWPQEQAFAFSDQVSARVADQIVGPDGVLLESWSGTEFTAEECLDIGEEAAAAGSEAEVQQ